MDRPAEQPLSMLSRRHGARGGGHAGSHDRRWQVSQPWPGVASITAGVVVWQTLVQTQAVPPYMLPAPLTVAQEWWDLLASGALWRHLSATLEEGLLGFVLALAVGLVLGYAVAKVRVLAAALTPYLTAAQAMPIIALAPLLVMWFGLGLLPKVIICALIVFFPILVNTVVGLRSIDPEVVEAARSMGAGAWSLLRYIEAPLALRSILGGVRVGVTLSMTGAVVGEFVASDAGLGYLMNFARNELDSALVLAAALTMVGVAMLGYLGVGLLERLLIDWE